MMLEAIGCDLPLVYGQTQHCRLPSQRKAWQRQEEREECKRSKRPFAYGRQRLDSEDRERAARGLHSGYVCCSRTRHSA